MQQRVSMIIVWQKQPQHGKKVGSLFLTTWRVIGMWLARAGWDGEWQCWGEKTIAGEVISLVFC